MRCLTTAVLAATVLLTAPLAAPATAAGTKESTQPALSHWYSVVREPAAGVPDHTVFRPEDLGDFPARSLPVIFFANGGCSPSNFGFTWLLTDWAAHGFVVIADGAYNAEPGSGTVNPTNLLNAIDWATDHYNAGNDADDTARAQFNDTLDLTKIAVAGQSCGGEEALVAGGNPRVKTVLALNTGFFPTPQAFENGYGLANLKNIDVPVLVVNGGTTDVAYQNSIDNYNILVAQGTPAYLASNANAGHSGLWFGIINGVGNTSVLTESEALTVNWLDYILNGNAVAGRYLFGPNCQVCNAHRDPAGDWTSQTNINANP